MTMRYSTIDQLQTLVPLAQDRELWKILTLKLTCFSVWVCSLPRKKKDIKINRCHHEPVLPEPGF